MLLPNASAQYELEDIRGSDPMAFESYDAYLQRFTVQEPGTWVRRVVDPERPELDFLNVRFLLVEPAVRLGGKWREAYRGADGALYENTTALPRFFSGTAEVADLRQSAPGEFSMRVKGPGLVISSEVAAPGRIVLAAGRRVAVETVEGTFMAFRAPAGAAEVRVVY